MMEKLMIGGQEVELPAQAAAVVKEMMDRYDEMMAKKNGGGGEDPHAAALDRKEDGSDPDTGSATPQVPVEQQAPDGRDAKMKVGASDTEGAMRAAGKTDEEGGAVVDPTEDLKRALEDEKRKVDGLQAKLDELMASKKGGGGKEKMDSADFSAAVRRRSRLERQAARFLPEEKVAKFDGLSDSEIRAEVIRHRDPKAHLDGKSDTYLEVRFDSIMENAEIADTSNRAMGEMLLKRRTSRWDGDETDPEAARAKSVEDSRNAWKQPLTAVRN